MKLIEEPVIIFRFLELKLLFLLPQMSIALKAKMVTDVCHNHMHRCQYLWTQKQFCFSFLVSRIHTEEGMAGVYLQCSGTTGSS